MDAELSNASKSVAESAPTNERPDLSTRARTTGLEAAGEHVTKLVFDPSGTGEFPQLPAAVWSLTAPINCRTPEELIDQLSSIKTQSVILFPVTLNSELDLGTIREILDILSTSNVRKIVSINGAVAQGAPVDLEPLRDLGAEIQWSVPTFLKHKIAQFVQDVGEITQTALAERMGISPSTLSHHLRRNHGFTDRVWARVCTTLGISPAEREQLVDLEVHGFSAEERMILEGDIKKTLQEIVPNYKESSNNSPSIISHQLVLDHLITRNPELINVDRDKLATVVIFVMSENGFEDPRVHLWQSISSLQKEITQIHDRDVESVMRHQMIGNMFEQLALTHYQLERNPHVAQYCLTTRRDQKGQVLHTTDIIDLIVAPERRSELATLAHIESEIRRGNARWVIIDSGSISSTLVQIDEQRTGQRLDYTRDLDGSLAHRWTVPVYEALDRERTGKWTGKPVNLFSSQT